MVSFLPPSVLQGAPSDLHLEKVLFTPNSMFGAATLPSSLKDWHSTLMSPLPGITLCRTALPPLPLKALPLPMPGCSSYFPPDSTLVVQPLSLYLPVKVLPSFGALAHSYQPGSDAEALAATTTPIA